MNKLEHKRHNPDKGNHLASLFSIPSNSYRILPGFTTSTQNSGSPFPFPILTSVGFFVIGFHGKTRIQSLPCLFRRLPIATRPDSIWRAVNQQGSRAWSPYSPKMRVPPRMAFPFILPRCCLRYFTFAGMSIIKSPLSQCFERSFSACPYLNCIPKL